MDLNHVKGRLAEALVESIFRQAGYQVSRLGRESHVQRLVKVGADEFLPDFLVWKPIEGPVAAGPLYRLLTIEAKYRANLGEFSDVRVKHSSHPFKNTGPSSTLSSSLIILRTAGTAFRS